MRVIDPNEAVRLRIQELCEEQNMTVHRLCTISGVNWSTVNNYLSGKTKSTTVSTIQKLCDGLDISLQTFFRSPVFQRK